MDHAAYIPTDVYARSRGVSDPWGRGRNQSPGRRGGSLTPWLRYSSRFRGRHRPPADARSAARVHRAQVAVLVTVSLPHLSLQRRHADLRDEHRAVLGWARHPPWVFLGLFLAQP
jgi:hypothetical protein